MPTLQKALPPRGLIGFREVDAVEDPSGYVAFLDGFARSFHEMIETGIDLLRLSPDDTVLDLGCGHGAAFPRLAARVGAGGRIVGLDASRALIDEAQRRLGGGALPIELHVGDAHALPFGGSTFDAARADRVFLFVRDPQAAFDELVRVTRPGGRVVVNEGDFGTAAVDSSDVATTRALLATLAEEVPNGWIGRRLRAMFVDRGLEAIEVRLFTIQSTSFAEWDSRVGIERAVGRAIELGRVTEGAAAARLAELRERDSRGRFFATGMFFMAAGTKCDRTTSGAQP
jgi:ubiquinone/menaquinone biosynthesis C-methylase UbiE